MSGESSASVQSDISKVLGGDGCKATDEIGNVCGETGNFGILEHFQRIYADRMKKCGDNDKLAVSILKSWVHDLTEQNTMLVHTVEELERELLKRVDMMHEQLQKTNYIINRKSLLAKQEKDAVEVSLRQQVELLQNDVSSLLDVINQAQHQGIRPVNSLKLNTVSRNQIIGFSQSRSAQSMPQEGNPEDSQELVNGEVDNLKFQLSEKEAEISNYLERFEELKGVLTLSTQQPASSKCEFRSKGADKEEDSSLQCSFTAPSYANDNKSHDETSWIKESLKKQHDQVISLTAKSLELETNLRMAILQRDNLAQELQSLLSNQPSLSEIETQTSIDPYVVQIKLELDTTRQNLLSATKQVKLLSAHLKETDKVNRETQAALTVEVAEKHDQMLALKKEVQQLEEQLKQALVQKNFKDEIILQMRNELKIARNKLANEAGTDTDNKSRRFTYPSIPETGSVNDSGIDDGEISVSSRSSNVEVDQLLQKISDRDQELNVQKEKVAKLERELEALQNAPFKEAPSKPSLITLRELEEYRLCTVEAQAAVEDLKDEIEAITSDMKIQEEKMESFIKAVAASEDKLRNAHLKLAKALQIDPSGDLQILDNIQDVLAEAKDCMQDIRTKAEEFVRDRGRSEQRRTSRERKVDKLQGQLDNAHDNMRDGIEAIEQVLAERYEADSLSQREFSDGSYHSCRESDSSSCIKQVQHLEEQNAELLNTLAKVENQKRDMEVRAAQYLRELDRMKDQVGRRDFTDEMLNTKEQTIHELQGTLDSARRQMRELQLELERLTRERDGLKHLADQSTGCSPSQVADLQSELARVRNQLATVASKQALIEQYERRFQETSEQTEKLSTQLNSLSLNLQAKEKMLSNKEEMVSILQDTLDRTREELKLLKDKSGGSSSSSKGAEEGASGANGGASDEVSGSSGVWGWARTRNKHRVHDV